MNVNNMQQVFLNLINNAIDAIKDSKKKEIHIDIHSKDAYVNVTILRNKKGGDIMSKQILVIDDDEAIRESFLLAVEGTEYQVETAESGEEGIEMELSNKYDLIFLDLKMPVISGIETLREIRKTNKKIPVYIITAFYKEYFKELKVIVKEGIEFELIEKPIDSEQILMVVKSILEYPISY